LGAGRVLPLFGVRPAVRAVLQGSISAALATAARASSRRWWARCFARVATWCACAARWRAAVAADMGSALMVGPSVCAGIW